MREKIIAGLALAIGVGALGFALFGRQGLNEVRRLKAERSQLSSDITRLKAERLALEREIANLRQDPKAIEQKARQDLGMIRKGETVFLLPERHGR